MDSKTFSIIILVLIILLTIYGAIRCISTARVDGYTQIKYYWSRFLFRLLYILHLAFYYQPIINSLVNPTTDFNPLFEPMSQMTIVCIVMCLGLSFHDFTNFTRPEKHVIQTPWYFISAVLAIIIYAAIYMLPYNAAYEKVILLCFLVIFYCIWIIYLYFHIFRFFRIAFQSSCYEPNKRRFRTALGHFIAIFVVISFVSLALIVIFSIGSNRRSTKQVASRISILYTLCSALLQEVIDWMILWVYPDDPKEQMVITVENRDGTLNEPFNSLEN